MKGSSRSVLRRRARGRLVAAGSSLVWRFRGAWWGVKRLAAPRAASPSRRLDLPTPRVDPRESADRIARALALRHEALARRAELTAEGRARFEGKSVLFVLPVPGTGGGANVILSEARAMRHMGVDARILNVPPLRRTFEESYPDSGVPALWVYPDAIPRTGRRFDAVVATSNTSVPWVAPLAGKGPRLGYYVQDFEPWFYPEGSFRHRNAQLSYTLVPGMRLVTKTAWNREIVARETGAECTVVGPSFDEDFFRPRTAPPPDSPMRIAAMVRPASPRRAPERTLRVLSSVASALGSGVEVFTFGVAADDPEYLACLASSRAFPHTHLGVVGERELADLFGSVHVFADLSDFQAMGRTALEAMGCGATAVLPLQGGAGSFATDGVDALFVDTRSDDACAGALLLLARDAPLRRRLMDAALEVASRFPAEACALATLEALLGPDASPGSCELEGAVASK